MEYNDKNLLELYNQKLSQSEIATQLGVSRSKVAGRLRRIKAKNPELIEARAPGKHPLAEQSVEPVKKLPPNRNTFMTRPKSYRPMSKAEMNAMLKEAVENTK